MPSTQANTRTTSSATLILNAIPSEQAKLFHWQAKGSEKPYAQMEIHKAQDHIKTLGESWSHAFQVVLRKIY